MIQTMPNGQGSSVRIPDDIRRVLGGSNKDRLNTLIMDLIANSEGKEDIALSPEVNEAMMALRGIMFAVIYTDSIAKREEVKVTRMLEQMYRYYLDHPEDMSEEFRMLLEEGEPRERVICDYISGMSDQYCIHVYNKLFIPESWNVF